MISSAPCLLTVGLQHMCSCPQDPDESPHVLGMSGHYGFRCWPGLCKTQCIGAEWWSLLQGWSIRCRPPWCSSGLAAWEGFLFLLVSTLNFPILPTTFPWIGVKSGFGSITLCAVAWRATGLVLVPAEGMEAASPAPLPSHRAGHGHGTRPFLWRKEFFLTTTTKSQP